MAFSVLRRISRRLGSSGTSSSNSLLRRRQLATSSVVCDESTLDPSNLPSRTSPWLMLPPDQQQQKKKKMVYKFYNLAENQVLSFPRRKGLEEDPLVPEDDAMCRGSSHGWLAYLNRDHSKLILSNPLSGRHIRLPPLDPVLSEPPSYFLGGCTVTKVILSSPPTEDDCRAMMIVDWEDRLAFCCPASPDAAWTTIGDRLDTDGDLRPYRDCVYSSAHRLFFCVIEGSEEVEAWDLQDPRSPRRICMYDVDFQDEFAICGNRSEEEFDHKFVYCRKLVFLVEHDGDVFLLRRYIYEHMALDGSYVDAADYVADGLPHKTVDFEVFKYSPEERMLVYLDGSIGDGLSLFIGLGHSFALRASDFPEVKPNSIYFTDDLSFLGEKAKGYDYGGHDIGVFDYQDKTLSPCYFPCDRPSIRMIDPAPIWFTPNPR